MTPLVAEWQAGSLAKYPLPEDWDLQAFSPLTSALQPLDMRLVGRWVALPSHNILHRRSRRLEAPSAETIGLLRCQRLLEVAAKLETATGVVKLAESGQWEAGQVVEGRDDLMNDDADDAGQVMESADGDDLMMLVERLEAELLEDIDSSEEEPEWEASPQVTIRFITEFCSLPLPIALGI